MIGEEKSVDVGVFSGDRVNWDYGDRFVSKNTEQTPVFFPEIPFQFLQARDRWELETSVNDSWFKKDYFINFYIVTNGCMCKH